MAADVRSRNPASSMILAAHQRFIDLGFESTICAGAFLPEEQEGLVEPFSVLNALGSKDVVVLHFGSIGFDQIREFVQCDCQKVLVFYSVVDPDCFKEHDRFLGKVHVSALRQLEYAVPWVDRALSVSPWADEQLERAGSKRAPRRAFPFIEEPLRYHGERPRAVRDFCACGGTKVFSAGDILPNRRYEDVLRAFRCYQQMHDPHAMLCIAGKMREADPYFLSLERIADSCEPGSVRWVNSDDFFEECMTAADLYLSQSASEDAYDGFVGAMRSATPIIAHDCPSVRGIVGDGALLMKSRGDILTAGAMHEAVCNESLRKQLYEDAMARGMLYSASAIDAYVDEIGDILEGA